MFMYFPYTLTPISHLFDSSSLWVGSHPNGACCGVCALTISLVPNSMFLCDGRSMPSTMVIIHFIYFCIFILFLLFICIYLIINELLFIISELFGI